MSFFRNYDPSQVTFSFKGIEVRGFMDSTFIEAERSEDGFSTLVGSGGDVTRIRSLNRTGKIKLTLMAQAPVNDILMEEAVDDEILGLSYGPLLITDLNGTMMCHAAEAWISKLPKIERAKEAGSVEWEFECANLTIFAGGNVL